MSLTYFLNDMEMAPVAPIITVIIIIIIIIPREMYVVYYKLTRTLLVYMVVQVYQAARSILSWEMTRVIPENK